MHMRIYIRQTKHIFKLCRNLDAAGPGCTHFSSQHSGGRGGQVLVSLSLAWNWAQAEALRHHLSIGCGRELRQENQGFKTTQEQGKTLSQKEPQTANTPTYPPPPSFCTRNLRRTAGECPILNINSYLWMIPLHIKFHY